MSTTISFRVSEELEEFLEDEAERRMTTKSTVAQMLLAEKVTEMVGDSEGESEGDGVQEHDFMDDIETVGVESPGPTEYRFQSKEQADAFRQEVSDKYISEEDDKRLRRVRIVDDANVSEVMNAVKSSANR